MERTAVKQTTEPGQRPSALRLAAASAYSLLVGLIGLGLLAAHFVRLISQASSAPPGIVTDAGWLPAAIFACLSFLVQRSSFHLGSQTVHSLAGVIDLAALLALGPVWGGMVAATSGLAYLLLSALRRQETARRALLEIPLFNGGLKALLAFAGGGLFAELTGQALPLTEFSSRVILPLGALYVVWFTLDHLAWGLLDCFAGGAERLRVFVRDAYRQALLIELLPLPLSIVLVTVYNRPTWLPFTVAALSIVAGALLTQRWASARGELTQRVAELSTIEEVGRAITQAQLDVDELCELLYQTTSRVVDTTIFHLGLFEGEDYAIKLWMLEGKREAPRTFRLSPGVGLVNWLRETGKPLLVRDFERELDTLPASPAYVSDNPPRSALFVPLIAGEKAIGTLSVQSFRRHAYAESDLRVLSAMANQAAVAIQKAQMFAQERKRRSQLETIGEVSRQVTATLELEQLFENAVQLIRDNFGYYHVGLFSADATQQTVTFQTSASAGTRNVAFDVAWGQGLIGWVAAHAESVMINDVEHDTRYRCIEALEETQSELAVPLCLDDELVGVLDVQSDQRDAFGPDDVFILETLGDQVAIAIQEARLYEAERQQAWLSTALLQVAEASSRVAHMDDVLTTIVRLTPILAGVDRCAILFWDADHEVFHPAQAHGLAPGEREAFADLVFPAGAVPALDLLRDKRSSITVASSQLDSLLPTDLIAAFNIHEMVLLPLQARGELLGAMLVDYAGQAHAFTERTVDMLSGIANQAALVVQNARLYQAQQEEAYVSLALLQVAEAVNRSPDLDQALSSVARITPMLVGVEACALFLWDPDIGAFVPSQQYGLEPRAQPEFKELMVTPDDPLAGTVLSGQYPDLDSWMDTQNRLQGSRIASILGPDSLVAMPLSSKGSVLGMMVVAQASTPRHASERWLSILRGIADQAAVAVDNDRLRKESAEQARMKEELEVAHRIQSSFVPDCCPDVTGWEIAVIWRSAREVGGDFYDFIEVPHRTDQGLSEEHSLGVVIADVADKGVPAALFMALSRTLMRTMALSLRSPAEAVGQANNLILSDARSGLFVTLFYAILQPGSGEVQYVNAGHMPPLLIRAADGDVEQLRTDGMALGVLPDVEFEQCSALLDPGDTMVLYTDGVSEASDPEQNMLGRERLTELARDHRFLPASELAQKIDGAITAFVREAPQFDDLTLLVVKRTA